MHRVAAELERQFPDSNTNVGAVVVPVKEDALGNTRVELLVLMGAAAAVLLIACANLASLLLSRAVGRRGELAVRAALGATRGRLVRQLVIEAALVALAGGAIGLALAPAGTAVMAQLTPRGFAALPASVLDLRLLGFTLAVSLATAVLFSIVPALQASRVSLQDALQQSARSAVGGRGRLTRDALVVLQVAAALVLLVGAGLMLRTLANLRAIDVGFRTDHMMTMRTTLPATRYRDPQKRLAFYERVTADARRLPGVEQAAYISMLPFTSQGNSIYFAIEGGVPPKPGEPSDALYRVGTPGYLSTIGARLVDGRLIDERDVAGAPLAVVINETMKRRYWPDASPLGHQMRFGSRNTPLFTIVGVVKDIQERGYELAMKPAIYLSFAQTPTTWALPEFLAVRVKGNPPDVADALRRIVAAADPDQPIAAVRTMDEILELDVADRHQQMVLLGAFAGAGAAAGVDRPVRRAVVRGAAAQPRARPAHGAGRDGRLGDADRRRSRTVADRRRPGARPRAGVGAHAHAAEPALRRRRRRSGDLRRRGRAARRHRARGLLHAGAPRVAPRSDRGAQGGLDGRFQTSDFRLQTYVWYL